MGDPTYPLIPVLAFLGFAVMVIPFAYISPVDHTGTFIFMIWAAIDCLILMVDRVVWNGTSANIAPIWCDIATRLEIGISIGIPASLLCMIHATYCRVNLDVALNTPRWKRRYVCMTLGVGFGLPVVATALNTLVTANRYYILEDCGCKPSIFNTWVTYLIFDSWPPLLSLLTSYYCVRTILICRELSSQRIFSHDSVQNRHLFLRTLLCVGSLVVFELPFCTCNLLSRIFSGNDRYPGWAALKEDYNLIEGYPRAIWAAKGFIREPVYMNAVETLVVAFLFFSVFGFGEVARSCYGKVFEGIASLFRPQVPVTETCPGWNAIPRTTIRGRDSEEGELVALDAVSSNPGD